VPSAVETLSPTRVRLTVDAPFTALKPELDAAYREIGKQVRVQGFRPGKVPPRVIDQRVGRGAVLEQAVNEAVPRLYGEAVEESGLKPVAQPNIEVTKIEDNDTLEFTAEVDVRPEFDIPAYDALTVTVDAVSIPEADIDEQVEELRKRFATPTPVERAAKDGDLLRLDIEATLDGEPLEGGTAAGLSYELGSGNMLDGLDEALADTKAGDARTFTTALVGGEHAGREADVAVTVREVSEPQLPEVTDEWVNTIAGLEDVAAFREDVRSRLSRGRALQQGVEARDKVLEALLALVELPLPESVLEAELRWRKQSADQQLAQTGLSIEDYLKEQEKTQEEFDADVDKSARDAVKAQLVLDAIADAEALEVTEADLTDQLIRRAQRSGVSPDQFAQQLVNNGQLPLLVNEVRRGKALATVMEAATITDSEGAEVDLEALRDELPGNELPNDVQVDEDGRPFHVHADGGIHYLDDDHEGHNH
jgi:trigger factor